MAETKDEVKAEKKITREYLEPDGVRRKIVRVFWDPRENCVVDEYEVTRIVRDSKKDPVKVTTLRRMFSQDVELQKKYRVMPDSGVKEL